MPGISDPGERLVAAAAAAGHTVEVVPGPSAMVAALVVSGLSTSRFCFEGFLPRKGSARALRLAEVAGEQRTTVIFEAPHRVRQTVADLAGAAGALRRVALVRELTKLHEELRSGTLDELAGYFAEHPPRGELTIVLEGTGTPAEPPDRGVDAVEQATLLLGEGLSRREVVRRLSDTLGLSRNDAYRLVMELPS